MSDDYVTTPVKGHPLDDVKDTCSEKPSRHMKWTKIERELLPYEHGRPMAQESANEAVKYISKIVAKYPFQLRYAIAMPLWLRFCDEYCMTGDTKKALLAI